MERAKKVLNSLLRMYDITHGEYFGPHRKLILTVWESGLVDLSDEQITNGLDIVKGLYPGKPPNLIEFHALCK